MPLSVANDSILFSWPSSVWRNVPPSEVVLQSAGKSISDRRFASAGTCAEESFYMTGKLGCWMPTNQLALELC